nr:hypothetical protein [Tanacetum cinerariifolium]
MGDENPIRTIRDYSKPSHEGYRKTIKLLVGNNVDLLLKVPHHGLDLWLQVQIFYAHVDVTTQKGIDYAAGGRLRKLRLDEAWAAIERLAQYEDIRWNDTLTLDEVSLNFENPDIEQLLRIMKRKFDALMMDAISLMKKSKSVSQLTTNKIYRPPSEPSRQEEF